MQGAMIGIPNVTSENEIVNSQMTNILSTQLGVRNSVKQIGGCSAAGTGIGEQSDRSSEEQVAESGLVAPPTTERDGPAFDESVVTEKVINFAAFCITRVVALGEAADDDDKSSSNQLSNYGSKKESEDKELEMKRLMEGVVLLFARMRKHMGLRTSELLQALALIDIISVLHFGRGRFGLNQQNYYLILLICIILSHKKNCDSPLSNQWWGKKFGVPITVLNESEVTILKLLDFNITVSEELYMRYHTAIVSCT
ncbi:MAG: hypothetical protein EZS28_047190 [Streblomastix strix]|uniref:Uncharacterized protein n=1 Tax=Streblomastix strix TaxID=222440 RepID=A0A5J4THI1_9EUKA|nr:MAG: hypothetical protein EZS28_047190 [Streblomastix strix]